jgi:hypothetical protein
LQRQWDTECKNSRSAIFSCTASPSYRTAPTNNPRWPDLPLSTKIGNATTFDAVNAGEFGTFAEALGLTRTAVKRLLGNLAEKIETAAEEIIREFEKSTLPPAVRAGQLRTMRTIRSKVIHEMVGRLKA